MSQDERSYERYKRDCERIWNIKPADYQLWLKAYQHVPEHQALGQASAKRHGKLGMD